MAASLAIEEEQGACAGHYHPHNGYYAGDFTKRDTRASRAPTAAVTVVALRARELPRPC
jgi:hypothetical protein